MQRCAVMHGGHVDGVGGDLAHHRLLAAVWLGAEGGAFEHLAEIVGKAFREAAADRRRGEDRAVGRAAADDDVAALVEQIDVRVNAGHRHDAVGGVELALAQVGAAVETLDRRAGAHLAADVLLVHLGIEPAEAKGRQSMLGRQFLDDRHIAVDAAVGAGVAGRADDHGHANASGGEQHLLEILPLPAERAGRRVGTQRHGSDVVAA